MDIIKSIVSVAGFDASSGAGVIRDVDTFFSLGFHGIAVPTSIVIQGPNGVKRAKPLSGILFRDTLKAATQGALIAGIKIGVLSDAVHVKETVRFIRSHRGTPVVFDPVFAAKNGISLISERGIAACRSLLFENLTVLTPNADEASIITGSPVRTVDDAKQAAQEILRYGPRAVIIKGGHLAGDPVDIFYDGNDFLFHEKKRINAVIHGTGCSFSSILTCFLAAGNSARESFIASQASLKRLFEYRYKIDENGYYYVSSAGKVHKGQAL